MKLLESNQIQVGVPKKPKKCTGTRFASILELDKWNTPFKTWCAITKTYEDPFVDNKYTIAGKTIEPKIISYLNKAYFYKAVKSPTDIYGENYFSKTYGDFFPENKIFGGMWDALVYDDGKPMAVIENKTTKRAEDWASGKAPIYYALQACLYAWLLGVDDVIMVAAFLEESDYEHPELFVPSVENTIVDSFSLKERYPDFAEGIEQVKKWHDKHVKTGISPIFDKVKDKEILDVLLTNVVSLDNGIDSLLREAELLNKDIAEITERDLKAKTERLETVKGAIKEYAISQLRENDEKVEMTGGSCVWTLAKQVRVNVDKDLLKNDGLLDKYSKTAVSYVLTNSAIK